MRGSRLWREMEEMGGRFIAEGVGASTIRGACFQLKSQSGGDRQIAVEPRPQRASRIWHLASRTAVEPFRPPSVSLCFLFHHGLNCAVRGRGAALRPASCPGRRGRVSRSAGYRGYHWLVSAVRVITAARRSDVGCVTGRHSARSGLLTGRTDPPLHFLCSRAETRAVPVTTPARTSAAQPLYRRCL